MNWLIEISPKSEAEEGGREGLEWFVVCKTERKVSERRGESFNVLVEAIAKS